MVGIETGLDVLLCAVTWRRRGHGVWGGLRKGMGRCDGHWRTGRTVLAVLSDKEGKTRRCVIVFGFADYSVPGLWFRFWYLVYGSRSTVHDL
jgi:hypothetical protein